MNKTIKITGIIGLLASLWMFSGDMLLYFRTAPFGDLEKELLPSIGDVSNIRLVLGGLFGPLSACLYVVGFYHIYKMIKNQHRKLGKVMFALLSVGIIAGGAFHAFFPAFGIVAANQQATLIEPLLDYAKILAAISFFGIGLGWILFALLVVTKRTYYRWTILLATPIIWLWFGELWERILTEPLRIILAGGWNNLVMTIFFAVSLIFIYRNKSLQYE